MRSCYVSSSAGGFYQRPTHPPVWMGDCAAIRNRQQHPLLMGEAREVAADLEPPPRFARRARQPRAPADHANKNSRRNRECGGVGYLIRNRGVESVNFTGTQVHHSSSRSQRTSQNNEKTLPEGLSRHQGCLSRTHPRWHGAGMREPVLPAPYALDRASPIRLEGSSASASSRIEIRRA